MSFMRVSPSSHINLVFFNAITSKVFFKASTSFLHNIDLLLGVSSALSPASITLHVVSPAPHAIVTLSVPGPV